MTEKKQKIIEQINSGIIPEGYKKTKVGIVPVEWATEKISSFCDVVNGGTPNTDISEYWNGNIFWCTPTDITNSGKYIDKTDKKITLKGLKNSSANLLPINSILMCSRATIGPRSINTVPMATNQGFKSLIVDKKRADLLFINEVLELCVPIFIRKSCGSTFLELSKKDVGGQLIPFPPLPEQQKIAEILTTQDKLIELQERKIEQLKTLKKGYLQKMFPKKGCKYPELRFKGFTEPWEQCKLGEITNYQNGKGHEESQADEGKYELINLNSISIDGGLKPSDKFIEDGKETLNKDDLVMVLSDVGHGDLLGRVAIIPENNRFVLNQRVALLRIKDDTNPQFLFSIINANQQYFKKEGAGSSQLNISKSSVEKFEVNCPSVDEQRQIGTYFRNLDNLITLHQRKLDKEKQKKKALMQLLLTGKVRVST